MSTTDPSSTPAILRPGEPGFDATFRPWNLAGRDAPHALTTPAAATMPTDVDGVTAAIRWAADHGMAVTMQATGHGSGAACDDALLISTRALDECTITANGRIRIGAGVRWQQLLDAAALGGYAPVCGSAPGVGIVGLSTGGGIGPVSRTLGWTSDSVEAIELVAADGTFQRVTADSDPDLFWGVRGGKGALGVVTALELRARRIPALLAGATYFADTDMERAVRAWVAWSATLPREGSTSLAVVNLPPLPGVPAPLAGRCTVAVRFAWIGDPAVGERWFEPMHSVGDPVLDNLVVRPWNTLGAVHADPADPMPVHEDHALLRELDDGAVDEFLGHAAPSSNRQIMIELRRLGGALADDPVVPSAVCHRDAAYSLFTVGLDAPAVGEEVREHASRLVAGVQPWAHPGTLVNFAPYADPTRIARAYDDATRERLLDLAEALDPAHALVAHRDLRDSAHRWSATRHPDPTS